jgi:23S rRNA pseudouridine2605 synthase
VKVRVNKFLADAGVASRRAADTLIRAGKVMVDGRRPALGELVDPQKQRVTLNGRLIRTALREDQITLVLNKPLHVITSLSDEHGRATVADYLPANRRLFPVGRLDAETTGVLLCTTDGDLARLLTHPSSGVIKEYQVWARGTLDAQAASELQARLVKQQPDGSVKFSIHLTEGKNRQVRRMCAQYGLKILALARTRFGPVQLDKLKAGAVRPLTDRERRELEELRAKASRT